MSTLTVEIPEYIRRSAEEFAQRNDITLDQAVALALASHTSAWAMKGHMEERAKRGSFAKFRELMEKHVPDVEPEPHDRL
jgi:hypothetical protein